MGHVPRMSDERARAIRRWQDAIFASEEHRRGAELSHLGLELSVPPEIHAPPPMSSLLGRAVLAEVRDTDRVLDMGTGCGVNAILAASRSSDVVAADVNRFAVESARENAARNGVSSRVEVVESDVFSAVEGRFDLIVFDPPFRWFAPRDMRETATTDEDYRALTAFFRDVTRHLTDEGRVLVFFGTSGDSAYLHELIGEAGLEREKVASHELVKDGLDVEYYVYRLRRPRRAPG